MTGSTVPNGKIVAVSCAIVEGDGGLILAARRGNEGRMAGKWEFPGGKIDAGESPEACLHREMREEMGVGIEILAALPPVRHDYGFLSVELHPFVVRVASGTITLHEHQAIAWGTPSELRPLDWAEADIPILEAYEARRGRG